VIESRTVLAILEAREVLETRAVQWCEGLPRSCHLCRHCAWLFLRNINLVTVPLQALFHSTQSQLRASLSNPSNQSYSRINKRSKILLLSIRVCRSLNLLFTVVLLPRHNKDQNKMRQKTGELEMILGAKPQQYLHPTQACAQGVATTGFPSKPSRPSLQLCSSVAAPFACFSCGDRVKVQSTPREP
jgi:hypothetical protein